MQDIRTAEMTFDWIILLNAVNAVNLLITTNCPRMLLIAFKLIRYPAK